MIAETNGGRTAAAAVGLPARLAGLPGLPALCRLFLLTRLLVAVAALAFGLAIGPAIGPALALAIGLGLRLATLFRRAVV
ncbi:MAG: hypothetical protein K2X43_02875 [Hyphomonadaceae bacterium]|nr:hypothetical protein [Hyphomonadaceae bacterium]